MTKRINLPTNSWSHTKILFDKPMPKSCLVNHVNIMCHRFIMHAHPPISATQQRKRHHQEPTLHKMNNSLKHPIQQANSRYMKNNQKSTLDWDLRVSWKNIAEISGCNCVLYMNSSWPELTSCLTTCCIVSLWSLHHRWKKAYACEQEISIVRYSLSNNLNAII